MLLLRYIFRSGGRFRSGLRLRFNRLRLNGWLYRSARSATTIADTITVIVSMILAVYTAKLILGITVAAQGANVCNLQHRLPVTAARLQNSLRTPDIIMVIFVYRHLNMIPFFAAPFTYVILLPLAYTCRPYHYGLTICVTLYNTSVTVDFLDIPALGTHIHDTGAARAILRKRFIQLPLPYNIMIAARAFRVRNRFSRRLCGCSRGVRVLRIRL